eukprot:5548840-Amphidinium_carterae.2
MSNADTSSLAGQCRWLNIQTKVITVEGRQNPGSNRLHADTSRQSELHTAAGRQLITFQVQTDSMLIPAGSLSSTPQPVGSSVPYSLQGWRV